MLFVLISFGCLHVFGQVGINTATPSALLDVNGDVIINETLTLEDPGTSLNLRGLNLLVRTPGSELKQYDINISKYGPVNNSQFVFTEVSTFGLLDYDTKVSTSDYIMVVHSFYFLKHTNGGNTGVVQNSLLSTQNVEGYQVYAYKNTVTNTWFLRAFVNNANFQSSTGGYKNVDVDILLNVVVYREGFLTKEQSDINVNMSGNASGTAPLPSGF